MTALTNDKDALVRARVRGSRAELSAPGVVMVRLRLPFTRCARRVWIDVSRLHAA